MYWYSSLYSTIDIYTCQSPNQFFISWITAGNRITEHHYPFFEFSILSDIIIFFSRYIRQPFIIISQFRLIQFHISFLCSIKPAFTLIRCKVQSSLAGFHCSFPFFTIIATTHQFNTVIVASDRLLIFSISPRKEFLITGSRCFILP